jgi:hypothetical protein
MALGSEGYAGKARIAGLQSFPLDSGAAEALGAGR